MAEYGKTARDVAPAVVVVGRQFTVPYAVNLTLTSTGGLFSPNDLYKVKDANSDVVFKVKGFFFSSRCLLLNAAGNPLLTMKPKAFSWHETWRVFRGDSTNSKDLLFSVRKHKIFQWKDNFDVVLATNTDQAARCDFKIISRSKKCTICIGQTDEIIAQMHRKTAFFARDKLEITVNPNEDFAFIVSLIVILEEMEANRHQSSAEGLVSEPSHSCGFMPLRRQQRVEDINNMYEHDMEQ
ncbi:protein LURP-one-related 15-like [Zingiber officinale]|uniref:protein LURP-one-related 15-like n=1 Tax=Zingiber officinale TaxID=94328 RepID=UPI001C4A9793|nr:protein LURP-one-related 15-like [Zingiber officinale]